MTFQALFRTNHYAAETKPEAGAEDGAWEDVGQTAKFYRDHNSETLTGVNELRWSRISEAY